MKTVNFEPEFISRMIPKLEWSVLKTAAETVSTTVLAFMRCVAINYTVLGYECVLVVANIVCVHIS